MSRDPDEAFKEWEDWPADTSRWKDTANGQKLYRKAEEALHEEFLAGFSKGSRAGGSYVGREMREQASRDADDARSGGGGGTGLGWHQGGGWINKH